MPNVDVHSDMPKIPPIPIDGQSLTIEDVMAVARERRETMLMPDARERMASSHAYVETLLTPEAPPVYGINTGFGFLAETPIKPEKLELLQHNLIVSHAVGVAEPLDVPLARALMLLRANTLAVGHSGCRPIILETMVSLLNAKV